MARATGPAPRNALPALPNGLPALPEAGPRRFDVSLGEYDNGPRVAEVSYTLSYGDGRYRINTEGQAIGLVALVYSGQLIQLSEGRIGPDGLMPEHYSERRGGRPERSLRLDYRSGQLIGDNGDSPPVPLQKGTQDRLSLVYQLGLLVRGDSRLVVPGARLVVPVAGLRTIDTVAVTAVGKTTLRIGGRSLEALKFEMRNARDASKGQIDVWLSPDESMLPLRISITERPGRTLDQVIRLRRP